LIQTLNFIILLINFDLNHCQLIFSLSFFNNYFLDLLVILFFAFEYVDMDIFVFFDLDLQLFLQNGDLLLQLFYLGASTPKTIDKSSFLNGFLMINTLLQIFDLLSEFSISELDLLVMISLILHLYFDLILLKFQLLPFILFFDQLVLKLLVLLLLSVELVRQCLNDFFEFSIRLHY